MSKLLERPYYHVGDVVKVQFNGSLYVGEVVAVGQSRIAVRFTTGSGTTRERLFKGLDLDKYNAPGYCAPRSGLPRCTR